jgi:ubiquinone/menaquinone biosynthesis C-methylase UbiE
MNKNRKTGDVVGFARSWVRRSETLNNYFTRGEPLNQIQLAYRQHWSFIQKVIGIPKTGIALEVGCGRGSISSYFAEAGYKVTLLDSSPDVIKAASSIFKTNRHSNRADYVVGNALDLPFPDASFNVVISMGLLEHFQDVRKVLSEQVRILKPGGTFIGYVVPESENVQKLFTPVNDLLAKAWGKPGGAKPAHRKHSIYRSRYMSKEYTRWLKALGVKGIQAIGVYPFPAISPSPDFPFTLMPPEYEKALVASYTNLLKARTPNSIHPWACDESWGQSFFIWARKK